MNKQNLKVTIIEDNAQMAEMIADYLQDKFPGIEISKYNTGESALNEIALAPDVFILDYHLDSEDSRAMTGIQVLMKLKKKFNSPVIFLSSQEKPEVSANVVKYGAYDYVVKNQNAFHRLEMSINNIVRHTEAQNVSGKQNSFLPLIAVFILGVVVGILLMKMM